MNRIRIGGDALVHGVSVDWSFSSEELDPAFLHVLNQEVEQYFAGTLPRADLREKLLTAERAVNLAYAVQCVELAADSARESVSLMYQYLVEARDTLRILEVEDPRFAYPYSVAVTATQYAGELQLEEARHYCQDLRYALPAPLDTPTGASTYVVVQDMQHNEEFAETLMPSKSELRVLIVDADDVYDWFGSRAMVFDLGMWEGAAVLDVNRLVAEGEFTMWMRAYEATPAVMAVFRKVRSLVDALIPASSTIHLPLVEYYQALAQAHLSLDMLQHLEEAQDDVLERLELFGTLVDATRNLRRRNPDLHTAHMLATHGKKLCENLDIAGSRQMIAPLITWLPEEYGRRFPANWDYESNPRSTNAMIWSLARQSRRFVVVQLREPLWPIFTVDSFTDSDAARVFQHPQNMVFAAPPDEED